MKVRQKLRICLITDIVDYGILEIINFYGVINHTNNTTASSVMMARSTAADRRRFDSYPSAPICLFQMLIYPLDQLNICCQFYLC